MAKTFSSRSACRDRAEAWKPPRSRLSRTVISEKSFLPSGTWMTPRSTTSIVERLSSGSPSSRIVPDLGLEEPREGLQRRRLPRSVRADERHDLAGLDVEADVPERGHLPVRHLQPLDVQHHATRFPK